MAHDHHSSSQPGSGDQSPLIRSLQRTGLSVTGIRQLLQGNIVSDPADRAALAKILTAVASLPNEQLEHYPGASKGPPRPMVKKR